MQIIFQVPRLLAEKFKGAKKSQFELVMLFCCCEKNIYYEIVISISGFCHLWALKRNIYNELSWYNDKKGALTSPVYIRILTK